ncbi:MAG: hypothetical protein IJM73_03290, partial [Spirochaetales bacterium]|nr:hypothetical protein [Spirochaetales bacterium]
MKKGIVLIVILVATVLLLSVACKNDVARIESVNLSSLNEGRSLEINHVSSRVVLELTNFSLK